VKLSEIIVRPCQACKGCVEDNLCIFDDDFPELAKKVLEAKALVIGAYCPYGMIDAHTKAFLERLWSMRHQKNLNRGKLVVIAVSGVRKSSDRSTDTIHPLDRVADDIAKMVRMENMEVLGTIRIRGNVPCLTCGRGDTCRKSGVPSLFGKDAIASSDLCVQYEEQEDVMADISRLGQLLHDRLI
jgi:multimeric flavodoxin WrbA